MPEPGVTDLHYNSVLTNFSVMYSQDPAAFIQDQVFPTLGVQKKSDLYYIYTQDAFLRDEVAERAPATESVGAGWGLTTGEYACKRWALHKDIADEERANQDSVLSVDQDAVVFLTDKMRIRKEKDFVTNYMGKSIWSVDLDGAVHGGGGNFDHWSDETNGTPVDDIDDAVFNMQELTGYRPNTLVLGPRVWKALKKHPDIKDQYKYVSSDSITVDMVAKVLEIEKIVVPYAIENTAHQGQTAVKAFVHSKSALLAYVNPRVGLKSPTAGLTITWTGAPGAGAQGQIIRTIPQPNILADRVEIESFWVQKVVSPAMGTFFATAVA